MLVKLSQRLHALQAVIERNLAQSPYDHIWDCCCDHGLLGTRLLLNQCAPNIHFVDIVPKLMHDLEDKLERLSHTLPQPSSAWHTHCLDISALPLSPYQGRHLIIIAGVGGEQTQRFINDICHRFPDQTVDFLLCPVHQLYGVRSTLAEHHFKMKDELLIEENKRHYEILWVSRAPHSHTTNAAFDSKATLDSKSTLDSTVTLTGRDIWRYASEDEKNSAQQYLQKTLQHYQRMSLGAVNSRIDSSSHRIKEIIAAYAAVKISPY